MRLLACLIVAPQRGYDEPAILSYAISSFCPTSADGLHLSGQLLLGKLSETVVVVSNAPHNRPCGLVCHLIGNRASFLCTSQKRTFCKASHQLMGEMFRRSSSAVATSRASRHQHRSHRVLSSRVHFLDKGRSHLWGLAHLRQRFVRRCQRRKKPQPLTAGASWQNGSK